MTTTEEKPSTTREMWVELGLLLAGAVGARLIENVVRGVPGFLLGPASAVLALTFYWRCGVWAERVVRRKNRYHPQYFILGPIGLVMALLARRP